MKSCLEPPPVKRRLLVSNTPTPPKTSNTIQKSPHQKQTKSDSDTERTHSDNQETQKTGRIENKNKQKKLVKKV